MNPVRRWLSYDQKDIDLLYIVNEVLNRRKAYRHLRQAFYPFFHPNGIKELAESRGLRIAYTVVHLLNSLEVGKVADRLSALRTLHDEVMSTAAGTLRINAARALIQIMKALVRAHGDTDRQLELARDFRRTAAGNPRTVRRQLRRLHLLEMPEEWNQVAFDDHVHDANTKGRKSPTHLIMDAWIKGIRRITVIYYNFVEARVIAELLEAAGIMGITAQVGIEFPARYRDRYTRIIWTPRGFGDVQDYLCFLAEPEVSDLFQKGRAVSSFQQQYVSALLQKYNRDIRIRLSERFGLDLLPIEEADFRIFVGTGQASLLHLSKFLHNHLLEAMTAEVDRLKKVYPTADEERRRAILERVEAMRGFDSHALKETYLLPEKNPDIRNPDDPLIGDDPPEMLAFSPGKLLDHLGRLPAPGTATLNLSNLRAEDVLEILYTTDGRISRLELFNLKDFANNRTDHLPAIERLMHALNSGNTIQLKRVVQTIIEQVETGDSPDREDRLRALTDILHDLPELASFYRSGPLSTMIGSDSTGRTPRVHGMGLALEETLPRSVQPRFQGNRGWTPMVFPVRMVVNRRITYAPRRGNTPSARRWYAICRRIPGLRRLGLSARVDWVVLDDPARSAEKARLVALGGVLSDHRLGLDLTSLDNQNGKHPPSRFRLNSRITNGLKVGAGFVPAFLTFFLTKDWWLLSYCGAFIWFGITGLRNILQSVIGGGGLRRSPLLKWDDYVSWNRIADSLLWTGLSVPLLDFLVKSLLLDQALGINLETSPLAVYGGIGLANGIYIASHNIFRGLPKGAVIANLFRSILAIPVAVAMSSGIAILLSSLGIVGVGAILQKWAAVISKCASDVVAGFIEGTADRQVNIGMRFRDLRNRLTLIFETYAQLEALFPEAQVLELLESPDRHKPTSFSEVKDLERILAICALDLLYFWMYKPRARSAFKVIMRSLSREERQILIGTQNLLLRQKYISQLLIDGILGRQFPKALAFYLGHAQEYLDGIQIAGLSTGKTKHPSASQLTNPGHSVR
ncbi:MAG: hypothetical protein PVH30_03605 [Desulfobacterales bacterium]|jgi:hypothetical protein